MARQNILENIATAADMPAILLKQETFAEGFGEGTEDAKLVAGFIDTFRREIKPVYDFMDAITMHRAWNKEFFAVMQKEFPDAYGKMSYDEAFYEWSSSFAAEWPSLLTEPEFEEGRDGRREAEGDHRVRPGVSARYSTRRTRRSCSGGPRTTSTRTR